MNLRSAQFAKVGVATDVAVRSKFPKNFAFKVELNRA